VIIEAAAIVDWRSGLRTGGWRISVEDGAISSLSPCASCSGSGLLVSPGLFQAHVHLCQTLFRGMAEGRTLLAWLEERIWPLEASHDQDTLATSVILSLRELLRGGVTGLVDMGSVRGSEVTVDVLRRSGVAALAGNALMDTGPGWIAADPGWLFEECARVAGACGGGVGYILAPRFALSCSDRIWDWIGEQPRAFPRSTHASESGAELAHPPIEAAGGNIRFLHRRGFLGPATLLAHCVHLRDGEAGLLASTGTAAVHCPWANLRLGSGIADINALAGASARVMVGSDGAACNNRLDPAGDSRLAMALADMSGPGRLPSTFWLRALTDCSGLLPGLPRNGLLEPGTAADIAVLDLGDDHMRRIECCEDPVRYILELDWPSLVAETWARGRLVHSRGSFPTLPGLPVGEEEARMRLSERAAALTGRAAGP
jgi:5-methylthioadenosine/S-adenosylhomocysteine deaminase